MFLDAGVDLGLGYAEYAIPGGSHIWGWEQVQVRTVLRIANSHMVVKTMRVDGIVQEDM